MSYLANGIFGFASLPLSVFFSCFLHLVSYFILFFCLLLFLFILFLFVLVLFCRRIRRRSFALRFSIRFSSVQHILDQPLELLKSFLTLLVFDLLRKQKQCIFDIRTCPESKIQWMGFAFWHKYSLCSPVV